MGLRQKFWEINGRRDQVTVKGALALVGAFVGMVLLVALAVAIF